MMSQMRETPQPHLAQDEGGRIVRLTAHLYLVGGGGFGLSHAFDCNVYAIDAGNELLLVDSGAGCSLEQLIRNIGCLELENIPLTKILLTHSHADHSGGAHALRDRYGCQVYTSAQEAPLVEHGTDQEMGLDVAKRSGFYSPDYRFNHCEVDVRVHHNDTIRCNSLEIRVLHVPGHSVGSMCYLVDLPEGRALFSGDVVFWGGVIGLLNYNGSSLSDYRKYFNRLDDLGVDMLLPGHREFLMTSGQEHIDMASKALAKLQVPRGFI